MKKSQVLWSLLRDFFRYGCFTFGGGWGIAAQMQQTYVERDKTMTAEDLLDLTSVARSVPGTMITNLAMLYGYRVAGLAGGLVALFGMTLPPMLVLIGVTFFYEAFRSNYWVSAVMSGMQAAVVPIVINSAIGLVKGCIKFPPCLVVTPVCFCLYVFTDVRIIVMILTGAVSGLVISEIWERREARRHGAA